MNEVRVRVAPSPTGFAHVGTAYVSLFNYAFAKKSGGKFIVRLEDSDVKRNVKGADKAVVDGLSWLGLTWDEGFDVGGKFGPYKLSERMDIYNKKIDELLAGEFAYEDEGAVRFKNSGESVSWRDLIKGEITFPGSEVTDFVLRKSDGYPTYNFAVVVDDVAMKISHVIRGEEHVSNTPRQIALYKAFDVGVPEFAHHPTLRNKDHKKLSKRRDPVDLARFKADGYLPEALLNFLGLLGWSHPEGNEIFSLSEFVESFGLDRVRKSGPIFDTNKLDWINGEYVRNLSLEDLNFQFSIFNSQFKKLSTDKKNEISRLLQTRIKKFSEFDELAGFFFDSPKVDCKLFGKKYKNRMTSAHSVIESLDDWTQENLDEKLLNTIKENDYKTGEFFMDLRIAITGNKFTPPISDSILILGKKESVARIKSVL